MPGTAYIHLKINCLSYAGHSRHPSEDKLLELRRAIAQEIDDEREDKEDEDDYFDEFRDHNQIVKGMFYRHLNVAFLEPIMAPSLKMLTV